MSDLTRVQYQAFMSQFQVATGGILQEKTFLEILKNSQENTCTGVCF